MMDLQQDLGLSYVFISHDLSVVEHIADEVMVMYLGRCVEKGTKDQIFNNPRHPYTQALLSATPRLNPDDRRERIKLTGELPSPLNLPPGCAFNARCRRRFGLLHSAPAAAEGLRRPVACFAVDQDENPQSPTPDGALLVPWPGASPAVDKTWRLRILPQFMSRSQSILRDYPKNKAFQSIFIELKRN